MEPEADPRESQLFSLAEPEPDLYESNIKWNTKVKKKYKSQKCEANFLGSSAASNIKKARFCIKN